MLMNQQEGQFFKGNLVAEPLKLLKIMHLAE